MCLQTIFLQMFYHPYIVRNLKAQLIPKMDPWASLKHLAQRSPGGGHARISSCHTLIVRYEVTSFRDEITQIPTNDAKLCGICDANTRRGSAQLLHKSACQFVAAILRYQRPSGAPVRIPFFFVENGDAASRGRET